ncbi:MAG: Wzz/FepE/Etk N-terminal domain-containing protein [Gaiellaceae bacterium]
MSPSKRSEKNAELELEQEVDFGRYLAVLGRGWWLLVGGLVLGAAIGAAMSLGGGNLYKAKATVYLGQPLAVNSSAQIQGVNTNPSAVGQIVRSEEVLAQVAAKSGLPLKKLRAGVSTANVSGFLSKLGQSPLVAISVQAKASRTSVQDAANELAQAVVTRLSKYSFRKIAVLKLQIASGESQIAAIDARLRAVDATQATLLEQRRGTLSDEVQTGQLLLVQAEEVEQGSIVTEAKATKTTGRNRKNALIVGAALGLLIGALAALALPSSRRSHAG